MLKDFNLITGLWLKGVHPCLFTATKQIHRPVEIHVMPRPGSCGHCRCLDRRQRSTAFWSYNMQKRDSVAFKKHLWSKEEEKAGHHHMSFKKYSLCSYWERPYARHWEDNGQQNRVPNLTVRVAQQYQYCQFQYPLLFIKYTLCNKHCGKYFAYINNTRK